MIQMSKIILITKYVVLSGFYLSSCAGGFDVSQATSEALDQNTDPSNTLIPSYNPVDFDKDELIDVAFIDEDGDGNLDSVDVNGDRISDTPLIPISPEELSIDDPDLTDKDCYVFDMNLDSKPDTGVCDGDGDKIPDIIVKDDSSDDSSEDVIVSCGNNASQLKVLVCHVPPGNPSQSHEICIGAPAVKAHIVKGSRLGYCDSE